MPIVTDPAVRKAADLLIEAHRSHRPLATLPADAVPNDMEAAYAAQELFAAAIGSDFAGWKAGAVSAASMQAKGLAEPVVGRLFSHLVASSPATVSAADFFTPHLEAEFGFRMSEDLPARAAPYDRERVEAAVGALVPAIEIVSPRMRDWRRASGAATVADNVSHGALVLGETVSSWRGLDLAAARVELWLNGACVASRSGKQVYGHPVDSLTWLINDRSRRRYGIRADEVIITGTCIGVVPVSAGDAAVADFGGLGRVELRFAR